MTRRMAVAVVAGLVLAACGGGGGGGGGLTAGGGRGTAGAGGKGGWLWVTSYGGDAVVKPGGALPAMARWADGTYDLGANPRTITSATTLTASAGAIQGDDGATAATGLRVAPGAVLTLEADADTDGVAGNDLVNLSFTGAVLVEGTIRLGRANGSADAARWSGNVGAIAVRGGGRILAAGDDGSATVDGGAGGAISLRVTGRTTVQGTIDTRGGKGKTGGAGGGIDLVVANGDILVSGVADSSGGQGLDGVGGNAGGTEIWGRWSMGGACSFWLTGSMLARGGDGTAGGGSGAWSYGSSCQSGDAYSTGRIDTSGGSATVDGPGGDADQCEIDSSGGRVVVAGRLAARGGNGAGAGNGGTGNWIGVGSSANYSPPAGTDLTVVAAPEVDVAGGDGAVGGDAGEFELWDGDFDSGPTGVTYVSGGAVSLPGGPGTTAGGAGGNARLSADRGSDATSTYRIGSLEVTSALDLRGGAASAGSGGAGGTVRAVTYSTGTPADAAYPSLTRRLRLGADVRASGGDGTVDGGAGGTVTLGEHVALEALAAVDVSGGKGGTGAGGAGGSAALTCDGTVTAAAIRADGGGAAATGGAGGTVTLASSGAPSVRRGVISVRGGAATTAGAVGTVTVDGAAATLDGGQLKP